MVNVPPRMTGLKQDHAVEIGLGGEVIEVTLPDGLALGVVDGVGDSVGLLLLDAGLGEPVGEGECVKHCGSSRNLAVRP